MPLGEYGGLRQFASCDAEGRVYECEEIEQYMKTQTEALEQEKQLKNLFREFCERNPKYVVDGSYTTRDGKVVVDGANKAVKITAPTVTHIVPAHQRYLQWRRWRRRLTTTYDNGDDDIQSIGGVDAND